MQWIDGHSGLLAMLGIVVAIAGAFFGWKAVWQPHVRITWQVSSISSPSNKIEFSVDRFLLAAPHLVRVELRQLGRHDLTRENFASDSLGIKLLGARLVSSSGVLTGASTPAITQRSTTDCLRLDPFVLHRGNVLALELICDGAPTVRIANPLQNAKWEAHPMSQESSTWKHKDAWAAILSSLVFASIVYGGIAVANAAYPEVKGRMTPEGWDTAGAGALVQFGGGAGMVIDAILTFLGLFAAAAILAMIPWLIKARRRIFG